MTENFHNKLAEILEVDSVKDNDVFQNFEFWDSLATLSVISLVEENYKLNISADQILKAHTVGGLIKLIQSMSTIAH